jgi:uncharacterized RDD family membrane protein YckC
MSPEARRVDLLAEPASRVARIGAHVLDWGVVLGVAVAIEIVYFALRPDRMNEEGPIVWLSFLPGIVAQIALQAKLGQSLGKRVLGLRVVTLDGQPATVGRVVFLRNVIPLVMMGFCGLVTILDFSSLFRPDGRTFHDRLAATRVVRAR